jgi:hypothetical protein
MDAKPDDGLIGFFGVYPTPDKQGYLGALLVLDRFGTPEEFRVTYPIKPDKLQRLIHGASLERHIGVELCGRPLLAVLKCRPCLRALVVADANLADLGDGLECPLVVVELREAKPRLTAERINVLVYDALEAGLNELNYSGDYIDLIPPEVWEAFNFLLERLLQELENDAVKENGAAAARVHPPVIQSDADDALLKALLGNGAAATRVHPPLQDVPQFHFPPAYSESDRQACISLVEDLAQANGLTEPFERMRTSVGVMGAEDERFR